MYSDMLKPEKNNEEMEKDLLIVEPIKKMDKSVNSQEDSLKIHHLREEKK
jgi:hypothetical protein